MANHVSLAKRTYTSPNKAKLPYITRRRHMKLHVMGELRGCIHSLSRHEDILNPVTGRTITISYALPCQKKHTKGSPEHQDALGREWV